MKIRVLLGMATCLCLGGICIADSVAADQEVGDRSPFLPAGAPQTTTTMPASNPIELRGIMAAGNHTKYNLYNASAKHSQWLEVNEMGDGMLIKSADPERETVTVQVNGQLFLLAFKESSPLPPTVVGLPPPK